MSQYSETATKTLVAAAALAGCRAVTMNSSKQWAYATAGQQCHGFTDINGAASGASCVARLNNGAGTVEVTLAAACSVNDLLYVTGSVGKLTPTANGVPVAMALMAATADGDRIEAVPLSAWSGHGFRVLTKTADYTVTVGDNGTHFSTAGAAGTVIFAMPAAVPGLQYWFRVGAAQELRVDPNGTETISLPSTGVPGAAGKYLTANAAGESVHLVCDVAGTWTAYGFTGTWTAEA